MIIKTKVGKAFLKRHKQANLSSEQASQSTKEEKKVRMSRKVRNISRQLFESESSISLDISDFNNLE
jgi:hypothetical protein